MTLTIPRINLCEYDKNPKSFGRKLGRAVEEHQCGVILRGIDQAIITQLYDEAERFFDLEPETKRRYSGGIFGYTQGKAHGIVRTSREELIVAFDSMHDYHSKTVMSKIREEVPKLYHALQAANSHLASASQRIHAALKHYLGYDTYFGVTVKKKICVFRYPPEQDDVKTRFEPHTDTGTPFFPRAKGDGLEVLVRGTVIPVTLCRSDLLFLPGRNMEEITLGRIRAVHHQVARQAGQQARKRRHSIVFSVF